MKVSKVAAGTGWLARPRGAVGEQLAALLRAQRLPAPGAPRSRRAPRRSWARGTGVHEHDAARAGEAAHARVVELRGWSLIAFGPEWERTIGTSTQRIICSKAASDEWLPSISMPSRFISATQRGRAGTGPVPARLVPGAVGELVVAAVDRARHPHAEAVEGLEQRQVVAERPAVLDAEDDALAFAPRRSASSAVVASAILSRIGGRPRAGCGGAQQRRVARGGIAGGVSSPCAV
jgi:hypothetical protein